MRKNDPFTKKGRGPPAGARAADVCRAPRHRAMQSTPSKASIDGCALPGRTDWRAVDRGAACNGTASPSECASSYMSGWPVGPRFPHGFHRPCFWAGTQCTIGDRLRCVSLHDWHKCPALEETWSELPGHPASSSRWTCAADGAWAQLGKQNGPNAPGHPGIDRRLAFSMSKQQCQAFPWRSRELDWRPQERVPAIFGLDDDVRHALARTQWGYTVLAMDMFLNGSRRNLSQVHWTPCTNLAFTMCALRGRLANDVPGAEGAAGRLYLATKGADVLRRCRPDVLVPQLPHARCAGSGCRRFDATWVRARLSHDARLPRRVIHGP